MSGQGSSQAKVVIMDADAARAADLCSRLRFMNYDPVVASNAADADELAAGDEIAVLLGDTVIGGELEQAAKELLRSKPDIPVLVPDNEPALEESFRDWQPWHLDMPMRLSQLSQLLQRAERFDGRERRQRLTGNSPGIRKVRELIDRVAGFDTTVLVTGESGTGKELVARTIHDLSPRGDRPFVPINCGAIPAELLESELFGHEKGAFTGAVQTRVGRFEMAEGGTLFLDEIGDMTLPMQVKLLRVLQERTYERVGGNRVRKSDVRIIAATHRDLQAMVAKGEFREDLYYRLNVFPVHMPCLLKRRSDLPLLLNELLLQVGGNSQMRLSPCAIDALANYDWPGNIRELSNLVERLAIMHPQGQVTREDLPPKYRATDNAESPGCALELVSLPESAKLKDYLQQVEKALIEKALHRCDGVVARAARELKMRRTTLLEKISKYRIG